MAYPNINGDVELLKIKTKHDRLKELKLELKNLIKKI